MVWYKKQFNIETDQETFKKIEGKLLKRSIPFYQNVFLVNSDLGDYILSISGRPSSSYFARYSNYYEYTISIVTNKKEVRDSVHTRIRGLLTDGRVELIK